MAQCFLPGTGIMSIRHGQAKEHGRFLPPYTEIFTDHALHCMADLAIAQIKMCLCATLSFSEITQLLPGSPRAGSNGTSAILKGRERWSCDPPGML